MNITRIDIIEAIDELTNELGEAPSITAVAKLLDVGPYLLGIHTSQMIEEGRLSGRCPYKKGFVLSVLPKGRLLLHNPDFIHSHAAEAND